MFPHLTNAWPAETVCDFPGSSKYIEAQANSVFVLAHYCSLVGVIPLLDNHYHSVLIGMHIILLSNTQA